MRRRPFNPSKESAKLEDIAFSKQFRGARAQNSRTLQDVFGSAVEPKPAGRGLSFRASGAETKDPCGARGPYGVRRARRALRRTPDPTTAGPPEAAKGRAVGSVISHAAALPLFVSHAAAALPLFDIVTAPASLFRATAPCPHARPGSYSRIDSIIEPGACSRSNGACVESSRRQPRGAQSLTTTPSLRAMPAAWNRSIRQPRSSPMASESTMSAS